METQLVNQNGNNNIPLQIVPQQPTFRELYKDIAKEKFDDNIESFLDFVSKTSTIFPIELIVSKIFEYIVYCI